MTKPRTDADLAAISDPVERLYETFRSKSDTGARLYPHWEDLDWFQRELFTRGWKLGSGRGRVTGD